jgi:hypothetical protein
MNRTLLLLTALALVPGCYGSSSCNTAGSVTFYWRFVSGSGLLQSGNFNPDDPATPTVDESGCTYLGVPLTDDDTRSTTVTPSIRITVDGVVADTVGCIGSNGVPGALLPGFFGGAHTYTIDAIRAGRVVFTASGSTNAPACVNTPVDVVLQAVSPSDLVVLYDVNGQPPTGCQLAGVPITHVAYEIRDSSNQFIVDASCASRNPPVVGACQQERTLACDPVNLGFTSTGPLAFGNYRMNYLELWQTTPSGAPQPIAQICASDSGAAFVHDGFPVLMNLSTSSGQFCPGNNPASGLVASTTAAP